MLRYFFFSFRRMSIKNMVVVVVLVFIWLKVSWDQILVARPSQFPLTVDE